MALIKEWSSTGSTVTDEFVRCDEPCTVGGSSYYRGFFNYIPNDSIEGDDSASYGVYSAESKGGTRYDVLISGMPSITGEVSVDVANGVIYSTTDKDVYVTYLGHGPIRHYNSEMTIHIPFLLTSGEAFTVANNNELCNMIFPVWQRYVWASIFTYGLPSASVTLTLKNETSGGESQNITVSHTDKSPAAQWFSTPFTITTSQQLIIETSDGLALNGFYLRLGDF